MEGTTDKMNHERNLSSHFMHIVEAIMLIVSVFLFAGAAAVTSPGHKSVTTEIRKRVGDIELIVVMDDRLLQVGDTVSITYMVRNHGQRGVYAFDPDRFLDNCGPIWNEQSHSYDYDLGAEWYYLAGVRQDLPLKKLNPGEQMSHSVRFKIQDVDDHSCSKIEHVKGYTPQTESAVFVRFLVGFFLEDSRVRVQYDDKLNTTVFRGDEDVLLFEAGLQRIVLGPLVVKIRRAD